MALSGVPSTAPTGAERPALSPAAMEGTGETDSVAERAGFEPSVPGESGFDFAREVRGRLFAGGRRIRTVSPPETDRQTLTFA
jgi:hypothetical protein